MSNAIEVFQPEYARLALPAGTVTVLLDGVACDDLEPLELVRSGPPEYSWVRLAATQPDNERLAQRFAMGRKVSLHQLYHRDVPQPAIRGVPIFVGNVESIETALDGQGRRFEIIAKDRSAALERITVYGQRILQAPGQTTFLAGLDTIFNPQGRANAATGPVFQADHEQAVPWGCAEAISYLLNEYVPLSDLYRPGLDQLRAITEGRLVRDLDVTGLSLLEALYRCGEAAGLRFRFVPRTSETGPDQAIVFYRNGRGRTVELNCQWPGQSLSLSRTNVATLHSRRDFHPVTHRHIGQGDFKTYEATFELVGAWDPSLEDTDYAKFSASTNPQFHEVRDVYRKWCLNEAGDYTPPPYERGEPYDFSRLFEGAAFVRRRRRFWPALSTDGQGRSLGYLLEVSFDAGMHWWQYVGSFNNLLDECGVWLASEQLDVDTWVAALKGALRFRITASVVSDERLTCIIADGPVGSTAPVVDHIITLPRRFRYRKVSPQSLLAHADVTTLGEPDTADDTEALYEFLRGRAEATAQIVETIQVRTPTLTLHVHPGDRVTSSPDSRDVLTCRSDTRSLAWIERVHVDFRTQCTQLKVVRQRT
ncbi:MAG TPA: hypothetical protein PLU87_09715 [Sedimentisphaerales bacterium]|nr:hypothetical protein [Sedimentisphaerales bacterium]HRS11494.1 hypothetical protein [Sedimentisphaerales bacterium]HRV47968.1 hypothetical protein [Sedimentisphaerales bacterium]